MSVKGVKLVRWGLQNNSEMVKKNFTNEPNGEEKLHYCTNKIRGGLDKFIDEPIEIVKIKDLDKKEVI